MILFLVFGISGFANAELIDRSYTDSNGNYWGMVYDDVLDITWLADANYAVTSGYDANGLMTWADANTWADTLVFGGYNDWRLPTVDPIGSTFDTNWSNNGTTDHGYPVNSTASEMAYMYYVNLGNLGFCMPDGGGSSTSCNIQSGWGLTNTGLFTNIQSPFIAAYWSGTATDSFLLYYAWHFSFSAGHQSYNRQGNYFFSWAVRDGDVIQHPIANAGPDRTVIIGELVSFDGSPSSDPDGDIVSYDWDFGDGYVGAGQMIDYYYGVAGGYLVTLTVTDNDGATGEATLVVTVLTHEEAIENLIIYIDELDLHKGTTNSLASKLESVLESIAEGSDQEAQNQLNAFINQVEAQSGKKISEEDAAILIEYALNIINSLIL